jgi:hypothetical protein
VLVYGVKQEFVSMPWCTLPRLRTCTFAIKEKGEGLSIRLTKGSLSP